MSAAWIILLVCFGWFSLAALGIKLQPQAKYIQELSPRANAMFRRWKMYYLQPFAGADFSSACSMVGLTSLVLGAVAIFKGAWIWLSVAVAVYFVTCFYARLFNPTNFLRDRFELVAHTEILEFLAEKREQLLAQRLSEGREQT